MGLNFGPNARQFPATSFEAWSPDMAYALGLFFADGSLRWTGHSWHVQFYNTDLPTVTWWHVFIGATNGIRTRTTGRVRPLYSSRVTDTALGEALCRLGVVPRKSVVDHPFPQVPEPWLPHFLRGFFDGDGGVWLGSSPKMPGGKILKVSLTCNSPSFREGLQDTVQRAIGQQPQQTGIHLRLSGAAAEKFLHWLYRHPGPHMTRKKDTWKDWNQFRISVGGLISESGSHARLRGLRHRGWHELVPLSSAREVAIKAGVSRSRVYQVRQTLMEVQHGA